MGNGGEMDASASRTMKRTRARDGIRLAIPVVWAAGMFASRLDPWLAIGIAAAILVAAVLATDAARVATLLRPTLQLLVIAVLAAAAMIVVTDFSFPAAIRWMPSLRSMSADIYGRFVDRHTTPATLAFVVPLVFVEEILWRGAFQDALPFRSQTVSVLLAAAIYAAAHAPFGSALLAAVAFVCALYWSALRAASGSLVPSLVAHLAWDVTLIIVPLVSPH